MDRDAPPDVRALESLLLIALTVVLDGCGDGGSSRITASELMGTYDVTTGPWRRWSGKRRDKGELLLRIETDAAHIFEVGGAIESGGAVRLDGQVTIGGDVTREATGEATVRKTASGDEIAGSLVDNSTSVEFAMERPSAGVSSVFSDQYAFEFQDKPQVAVIALGGVYRSECAGKQHRDVNVGGGRRFGWYASG